MATREEELIQDAIDSTQQEIFDEAFGKEASVLDETGDRTVETMGEGLEGQHEPEEDEEAEGEESEGDESETEEGEEEAEGEEGEVEAKPEETPEAKAKPEEKPEPREGRVPSGKLREANEARRAAEAERDALKKQLSEGEARNRSELDQLKGQLNGVLQALQQRQPPQQQETAKQPDKAPDIFEDPQGFVDYIKQVVQSSVQPLSQAQQNQRVETSFRIAKAVHKEAFDKAWEAVNKLDRNSPDDRATVQRIWNAPDQGEALIEWHKRNETLARVGNDPTAFEERIRNETREALMKDPEFRKSLVEAIRAEAETGDNGRPRNSVRLPKSLNGTAGSNRNAEVDPRMYDDSDQAVFDSAFAR